MPLQTAKTSHPKRFLKNSSKILTNQQNSNETCIPLQISAIVEMKFIFGEQYAKVSFEVDQSLQPQWESVKNIQGVEGLILEFQQMKEEEDRAGREERLKELKTRANLYLHKDYKATTNLHDQLSTNTITAYKSKIKTVTFAQNINCVQVPIPIPNISIENVNNSSLIKTGIKHKPILKSALRVSKVIENQKWHWQWNGILLKGKTRDFVAKVIVKPLKEGSNYKTILDTLEFNNAICMTNAIPLSYALYLVGKGNDELSDIFLMESESGNLKEEKFLMKFHNLVTFIRLENDYNGLYFFVFGDYRWLCKNLSFDQETTESLLLVAKNVKIKQGYLFLQQPSVQLLDNETNRNANYYKAKTELVANGYNDFITKLCEQKPNFTVYANLKFGEAEGIINVMRAFGANYFPNYYCDNMDLVLVHVLMLDQINFMPNLIKLKRQDQCKFFVYGWDFKQQDSIKFEECFISGGILSVTIRALLEEGNGLQRILDIIEYQKEKGANWKVLLDPEIKYNKYNLDVLINTILNVYEDKYMMNYSEIDVDYFDILLWKKLKKENETNMSRLYYALLYSYSSKNPINQLQRHCILIAHEEEISYRPKISGVDVMTLKDFEEIFGLNDNMEWETSF
ncbi:12699_t:CDS:10 [Funneliformis geosporum]|uniref:12852_t:CDS:1 n=1 Tax=Funneliformis geosporum TaxID=1117311 RepID=A0A9W4SNS1_9GLOM|nr:12852_t:CDS:10 [Funneliformis geosporum]CAI2179296.1 12699_t:CDS:10 [Funneliformis geosporum]